MADIKKGDFVMRIAGNNSTWASSCREVGHNPTAIFKVAHAAGYHIRLNGLDGSWVADNFRVVPDPNAQIAPVGTASDAVRAPSHYMLFDGTESIEVIARAMTVSEFRGFCFGNVLKYRLRAGKKSELATMEQDLKKAAYYGELFEKHKGLCHG